MTKFINEITGAFSQYFLTIFSYCSPIEYARKIFEYFLIYNDTVLIDALLHLLNLNAAKLMQMDMEAVFLLRSFLLFLETS